MKNYTNSSNEENRILKLTVITLIITIFAIILVSSTYAKFVTSASGMSNAIVAKWSFDVNGKDIAIIGDEETITFDLFNTINDSDGKNEETDVEKGLIAPGTSGSFEFELSNTSEVTAQYGIDFKVENENNIPIKFSVDSGNSWSYELEKIEYSSDTVLPIGSSKKIVPIMWKWEFENDTKTDTDLAVLSDAPNISIEATVSAIQVSYITAEKLQQKYSFSYYNDLQSALAAVNGGAVETNNGEQTTATVGVYTDENSMPVIVLLDDVTITETLYPQKDMVINLAGYTLTSADPSKNPALDIGENLTDVDVVIEGTAAGSKFIAVRNGVIAKVLQPRTGSLTINGATIEAYSINGNAVPILGAANMTINDATIIATCIREGIPDSTDVHAVGIQINGPSKTVVNNSLFIANSDYIKSGSNYTGYGCGIRVMTGATAVLTNTTAKGSHSGISNQGTVYIDGGLYESYGHGGVYFGGLNNIPTTSYVRNATIRQCEMTEGFEAVHGGNDTGFYVGGSSTANYITVYIDNSNISGEVDSFAIRDTKNEHDNKVYISNSTINTDAGGRVDGPTVQLYIGSGNNFDGSNITCRDTYDVTEVYTETDTDYSQTVNDAFTAIMANQ